MDLEITACGVSCNGYIACAADIFIVSVELDEQKVTAGIVVIYVVSTFVGGLILGKLTKVKRFAWGLTLGVAYFVLLLLISLGIYRGIDGNWSNILTTFLMCAGGGMFGGMIS
mgnify:CR=1 FL=1